MMMTTTRPITLPLAHACGVIMRQVTNISGCNPLPCIGLNSVTNVHAHRLIQYLELSQHVLVSRLSSTVEVTLQLPLEVAGLVLLSLLLPFTTSLLLPQVVGLTLQATELPGEEER